MFHYVNSIMHRNRDKKITYLLEGSIKFLHDYENRYFSEKDFELVSAEAIYKIIGEAALKSKEIVKTLENGKGYFVLDYLTDPSHKKENIVDLAIHLIELLYKYNHYHDKVIKYFYREAYSQDTIHPFLSRERKKLVEQEGYFYYIGNSAYFLSTEYKNISFSQLENFINAKLKNLNKDLEKPIDHLTFPST